MDLDFVRRLRQAELDIALTEIASRKPAGSSIVEIGGGGGWQARMLADAGFQVRSFDLAGSQLQRASRVPHRGLRRPSHPRRRCGVRHCFLLQRARAYRPRARLPGRAASRAEARRHCRAPVADGVVAAVDAGGALSLAGQGGRRRLVRRLAGSGQSANDGRWSRGRRDWRGKTQRSRRILVSERHGEVGNAVSELWHFSRHRWTPMFEDTGWRVASHGNNGLFYTGYSVLGRHLSLGRAAAAEPPARRLVPHLRAGEGGGLSRERCGRAAAARVAQAKASQ